MLIVMPTTAMTENASQWLTKREITHDVIPIPESLEYKTGSDVGIYIETVASEEIPLDIPMELTKARFVVMRVFKGFVR